MKKKSKTKNYSLTAVISRQMDQSESRPFVKSCEAQSWGHSEASEEEKQQMGVEGECLGRLPSIWTMWRQEKVHLYT